MRRSTGIKQLPGVVSSVLVLAGLTLVLTAGCDAGQIATFGLKEAALVTGAGPVTFEPYVSLAPMQERGEVDVLDLLPTDDPNVFALRCQEWSSEGDLSGSLRFVDLPSGSELFSRYMQADLCFVPMPVEIHSDGEFVGLCGPGSNSPVGVVTPDGRELWSFDNIPFWEEGAPADIAAGDIDADGDLEFCVSFTGSLGCFDENGHELWRVTSDRQYEQVAIISRPSDSPVVIAIAIPSRTYYPTYLEGRDGNGDLLTRSEVPFNARFDLVSWPPHRETPSLMRKAESQITFRSWDGDSIAEYPIPRALTTFRSRILDFAVTETEGEPFLVVNFAAEIAYRRWAIVGGDWPVRSALVVYDAAGNIVHFEILDDFVRLSSPVPGGAVFDLNRGTVSILRPPVSDSAQGGWIRFQPEG